MAPSLLSSDIFLEGFHRRLYLADDLKMMQKIMNGRGWHQPLISVENILVWENKVIVITDSKLKIIHSTKNMLAMNGYSQNEVTGKSPKMF